MIIDDWDKLSRGEDPAPEEPTAGLFADAAKAAEPTDAERNAHLNKLVSDLWEFEAQAASAKEGLKHATEDLARFAPEAAGEAIIETDLFRIVVSRAERFSWDADILEQLFEQGELPPAVKRKLTVDKKRYDQLPEDEQTLLRAALTIKVGPPKIEVRSLV